VEIGQILFELWETRLAKQYLDEAVQRKLNLGQAYEWKGRAEFDLDLLEEAA